MDRRQATALFALVLTGCGGGSGGGTEPSPPPPPPPQPPPGTFGNTGVSPTDGSTGVGRNSSVTATFNAQIAADSIAAGNVRLLGPESNVIECELSAIGSSVQIIPKTSLPGDTRFTLHLDGAIRDATGRTLGATVLASFLTASQAWAATATGVGTLSSYTSGTHPSAVALPSGDVMIAWHGGLAGRDTVFASRYSTRRGSWSAPVTVHASTQFGVIGPLSIAACPNDDVVMFWGEIVSGNSQIEGARYTASSGSWSSLGNIQVVPDFISVSAATVVVDSHGNITVAAGTGVSLYAIRWDAASSAWSVPQRIDHPVASGYLLSLRVTVDALDVVVAAWIQADDDNSRSVYVARYDPAVGTWGAAKRAGTNAMQYMAMAVDGAGAITVAWATGMSLSSSPTLWSSRWLPGQDQWSAQVRLDSDSVFGVGAPVLVADAAGYVTASWMQDGTPRAARYASGTGWSVPQQLSNRGTPGTTQLDLVADIAGNLTLTLTEAQSQPMALRYSATQSQWLVAVPVGAPSAGTAVFANDPIAVVDRAGNLTLAWMAWNTVHGAATYVVSVNRLQ